MCCGCAIHLCYLVLLFPRQNGLLPATLRLCQCPGRLVPLSLAEDIRYVVSPVGAPPPPHAGSGVVWHHPAAVVMDTA